MEKNSNVSRKTQMRQTRKVPKTRNLRNHAAHKQLHAPPATEPPPSQHWCSGSGSFPTGGYGGVVAGRSRTKNEHLTRDYLEAGAKREEKGGASPQRRTPNPDSRSPFKRRGAKQRRSKIILYVTSRGKHGDCIVDGCADFQMWQLFRK